MYTRLVYGRYGEPTAFQNTMSDLIQDSEPFFKKLEGLFGDKVFIIGSLIWFVFAFAVFVIFFLYQRIQLFSILMAFKNNNDEGLINLVNIL